MLALAPQRVTDGGRIVAAPPALPPPLPRASGATTGFRVEPLPHDMARLIDPQGNPCGTFAHIRLAPATLAFLSR